MRYLLILVSGQNNTNSFVFTSVWMGGMIRPGKDPSEMNNLYGKKGFEKITVVLKNELLGLARQYEDIEAEKMLLQ